MNPTTKLQGSAGSLPGAEAISTAGGAALFDDGDGFGMATDSVAQLVGIDSLDMTVLSPAPAWSLGALWVKLSVGVIAVSGVAGALAGTASISDVGTAGVLRNGLTVPTEAALLTTPHAVVVVVTGTGTVKLLRWAQAAKSSPY